MLKTSAARPVPYLLNHKDGSLWARGQTLRGKPTGYWEWFRRDGTRLRSGTFDAGEQVGEWTTYDAKGRPHKVTTIKPRAATKRPPAGGRRTKARA